MAGAFQSRPGKGAPLGFLGSTKPLLTEPAPPNNSLMSAALHNQKAAIPVQPRSAAQTSKLASSLPAPPLFLDGNHFPQKMNGQAQLQRPKPISHPDRSNGLLSTASRSDHSSQELQERFKEGPEISRDGHAVSHDPSRLLRDRPTSDSATCSASKSPSATPDHRQPAINGGGEGTGASNSLSRAQSGISNLRLPDGNVLEDGPSDAQLHSDSPYSEANSGDSPPPQPSTPRHGPDDSPAADTIKECKLELSDPAQQLEAALQRTEFQHADSPDRALQTFHESATDHSALAKQPDAPLEDRGRPREFDDTPKVEMIADMFQAFLCRLGYEKDVISFQVKSHPQWHGLPELAGTVEICGDIPGLGMLSFQHKRDTS